MEHFWQSIPGFFTWPEWCAELAKRLCPGPRPLPHIIEVGAYAGQSAACLGVELVNHGGGRLDLVDLFNAPYTLDVVRAHLEPVKEVIGEIHQGDSAEVAKRYQDASLDCVFIDADHSYAAVARDIDAWLPKVRAGGIIAGHDFCSTFPGVIEAVTERFDSWHVHRGIKHGGNEPMQGRYWPVWWTRVGA